MPARPPSLPRPLRLMPPRGGAERRAAGRSLRRRRSPTRGRAGPRVPDRRRRRPPAPKVALASSTPSCSESTGASGATGPKVSSRMTSASAGTSARTVGAYNRPSIRRPPHSSSAPRCTASATWRSTRSSALSSISGPTSVDSSSGSPARSPDTRCAKRSQQLVVRGALDVDPVETDAGLPGVAELGRDRPLHRCLEVRVGEHDERRVPAELERHVLGLSGRVPQQRRADLRRAGKAELAHDLVLDQLAADRLRVLCDHEVGNARGQPGVGQGFEHRGGGERRLLGRLDDSRAPGGECRPQRPGHSGGREVPDRDEPAHAGWAAQRADPLPAGMRIGLRRKRRLGLGGVEAQEAGRVADLAARLPQRLAALAGDQARELLAAVLEQVSGPHEDGSALGRRECRPGGQRSRCRVDCAPRLRARLDGDRHQAGAAAGASAGITSAPNSSIERRQRSWSSVAKLRVASR